MSIFVPNVYHFQLLNFPAYQITALHIWHYNRSISRAHLPSVLLKSQRQLYPQVKPQLFDVLMLLELLSSIPCLINCPGLFDSGTGSSKTVSYSSIVQSGMRSEQVTRFVSPGFPGLALVLSQGSRYIFNPFL